MKSGLLVVPIVIVTLLFGFIFSMGMLTLRSSMIATEGSIELLRLHMEVAELHQNLLAQSNNTTTTSMSRLDGGTSETSAIAELAELAAAESETTDPSLDPTGDPSTTTTALASGEAAGRAAAARSPSPWWSESEPRAADPNAPDFVVRKPRQ